MGHVPVQIYRQFLFYKFPQLENKHEKILLRKSNIGSTFLYLGLCRRRIWSLLGLDIIIIIIYLFIKHEGST